MDFISLSDQLINALKPLAPAGEAIGAKVLASALWDWIKRRCQPRSTAAQEAVTDVIQSPTETNWEALKIQVRKALEQDSALAAELAQLLGQSSAAGACLTAAVKGNQNVTIQSAGSGNVSVQL